ncbi:Polysaccharide pyruvyl transferase [Epibacterium ulvae]|uniref:Polysaccharide pyruvyl transferase n=1 Tax=Epibacterium ulvae TaxID=1156985 RepID=A0A1G5RD52_9RHOB|nr:polysaccharide pyruvyl transferase family protein [Epibacterium ulvae]SCZ71985.1 Polysaccharide pyruvyl transferase [Epibacterium ulvae]
MKIGIITFHNTPNFGATLQCYALSRYLESLGHDVEVINYMPPQALKMYFRSQFLGRRRSARNIGKFLKFRQFVHSRLELSGPPIFRSQALKSLDDGRYDVVFTGSDEVWKVDQIRPLDGSFYFDFLSPEKTRLCSFAASASTVTDLRSYPKTKEWLARFDEIAVRDPHTGDMVKELTGTDPTIVCDPTFLWNFNAETHPKPYDKGEYLALYGWPNAKDSAEIRKFADRNGLKVIGVGARNAICDEEFINIGPQEWLGLIRNSSVVVTDFFHGIIFSLLFNRPLYAYVDAKKRMKLERIMGLAGLSHLLHDSTGEIDKYTVSDLSYPADSIKGMGPMIAQSKDFLKRNTPPLAETA